MADFVQTMENWRRMCIKEQDNNSNGDLCAACSLRIVANGCYAIYEGGMDYRKIESIVTEWVKEHPEPKYPSYLAWIRQMLPQTEGKSDFEAITIMLENEIPSDIAQKLGIQPIK